MLAAAGTWDSPVYKSSSRGRLKRAQGGMLVLVVTCWSFSANKNGGGQPLREVDVTISV